MPLTWRGEELVIDITITLEQVELSVEGTKFSVFATSQEWPDLDDNKPEWNFDHPEWSSARAEYVVDGITYPCGGGSTQYLQNGVRYRWEVDPVPIDAEQLTFTLTRLSEYWEGPWEFHVPLE